MRTLAVLPVKSLGAAKSRLAARLDPSQRAALAEAMLGDVLQALAGSEELEGTVAVTAEPRAATVALDAGAALVADTEQAGQSPAAALGIAEALSDGYERALLVPGDTPLVSAGDVDGLLRRSAKEGTGAAIVPDRHGTGTNALVLSPPDAIAPSFGADSCARHIAAARAGAVAHAVARVASLGHDVDTPDDLRALAARLRTADPVLATRTRATAVLSLPTGV